VPSATAFCRSFGRSFGLLFSLGRRRCHGRELGRVGEGIRWRGGNVLVGLRKVVLQQVIHEVLFFIKVRWRKMHGIDESVRRVRIFWLKALGLVPDSSAR
jgi:hypothetical protein